MALSKASLRDLEHIGIRPEIAQKLVEDKDKGTLKSLSDVVAALENSGARCQVKFEDNFKVEVDEKGEIELRVRKKDAKPKSEKVNIEKWSKDWDTSQDQNLLSASKRKGEQTELKEKKRRKAEEGKGWNAEEEEDSEEEKEKINVNTASEEELEELSGIGPSLARKIVKYREEHGEFRRLKDLDAVRGVSKRLVKELEDVITVGEIQGEEGTCPSKLNPVPLNGCLQYQGREVVRVMSWNLQCFSDDKATNRGVLEVICRAILENG